MRRRLSEKNRNNHGAASRLASSILIVTALSAPFNEAAAQNSAPAKAADAGLTVSETAPLLQEFRRTPQGVVLLSFAEAHGIRIIYDEKIASKGEYGEYTAQDNTVRLQRNLPLNEQAVYFAHELRHAWQDKNLGYATLEQQGLSPQQRFTMRRYLEADAFAFSAQFLAERLKQLQMPDTPGTIVFETSAAKNLNLARDAAGNIPAEAYRTQALEPAFAHLANYNLQHVAVAAAVFEDKETLLTRRAKAPGDADFALFLRRFGGMTFDKEGATALQDLTVTDDMLLHDYPQRGLEPDAPLMNTVIATAVSPAPPLERLARLQAKWHALKNPAPSFPSP